MNDSTLHNDPTEPTEPTETRGATEASTRYPGRLYELTDADRARLDVNFTYHSPKPDQLPRYLEIRNIGKAYATTLCRLCPPGRERALALTRLEELVMWANAAIARGESNQTDGPFQDPQVGGTP